MKLHLIQVLDPWQTEYELTIVTDEKLQRFNENLDLYPKSSGLFSHIHTIDLDEPTYTMVLRLSKDLTKYGCASLGEYTSKYHISERAKKEIFGELNEINQ